MKTKHGEAKALPPDEFLDEIHKRALATAKKVKDTHGKALSTHHAKMARTSSGALTNGTSPNLKELIKKPGAFCNELRRPIPLGKDC